MVRSHLGHQDYDGAHPPLFSIVEFNLCGLCNRKCVFCPRHDAKAFPNTDKHFPPELYEKIMRDLQKLDFNGTLLFSAFCEPLLYRHLEKVIELSKDYCPRARIEMVVNGDLATEEKVAQLFEAGLTTLCISMYDGPHQLEHFQKLQKKMGLSDEQIFLRKRWLPPKEHYGITLSNRAGAVELKDIGIEKLKEPLKQACYYPFYQVLVDYDGAVLLCAHDWGKKLIIGNVKKQSILEIWNNNIMKTVRTKLFQKNRNFPPCNLCDVQGVLVGKEHFNQWLKYYDYKKNQ